MVKDKQNVIDILKQSDRQGSKEDIPEGSRYVQYSDTLIQEMIRALEEDSK